MFLNNSVSFLFPLHVLCVTSWVTEEKRTFNYVLLLETINDENYYYWRQRNILNIEHIFKCYKLCKIFSKKESWEPKMTISSSCLKGGHLCLQAMVSLIINISWTLSFFFGQWINNGHTKSLNKNNIKFHFQSVLLTRHH